MAGFDAKTLDFRNPVAPNLPLATQEYDRQFQDQFENILRLYFNQLDNAFGSLLGPTGGKYLKFPYGAFHDSTTQSAAVVSTAYAVTFNSTDLSNGVSIGTPTSRIVVADAGVYNFQFSLQLDKSSGAAGHTYIWARVNGTNIANSGSEVAIQGTTSEAIPAWNFVLEMQAGDYFELMWSVDDTNIQLKAVAATAPVPAIPSVILTATFVSRLPTVV
jgi:hypothetical protein